MTDYPPTDPKDKLDNLTARFLERLTPKERELLKKRFSGVGLEPSVAKRISEIDEKTNKKLHEKRK